MHTSIAVAAVRTSCIVVRGGEDILGAGFTTGDEPDSPDYRANPVIWEK